MVMKFEQEVQSLEQEVIVLQEKIRFVKTLSQRERLLVLERELVADHERLKELRLESDRVTTINRPKIKQMEAEVKRLKEESFDVWMSAQELERQMSFKRKEVGQLNEAIKAMV